MRFSFFCRAFVGVLILLGVELTSPAAPFAVPSATVTDPKVEAQVEALIKQLTQQEKISLLSGDSYMSTQGIPRLKIPPMKFSDGPVGVRCWGKSTAYPANILLTSTWDREMAKEMGASIGRDARARGVHVMLGPGVNIYREAQNGRNFEYMGEDPYLASALVVPFIQGMQAQGVSACIKHYVGNEQEINRGSIDTTISKRALQEIYFPPFRAAIEEGHVWTLMAAYNKVNGEWCSANTELLTGILRDQWHFQGLVMSDWGAVHDTQKDLNAGLDLEMDMKPRKYYSEANIAPLLASGGVSQATLDEHVRRMLRTIVSMGFMDREQADSSIPLDDPKSAATALKIASEGIVLLKNEKNLLPLDRTKVHRIMVVGPNAQRAIIAGGGSSNVTPFTRVSLFQALKAVAGDGVKIDVIPETAGVAMTKCPFTPENATKDEQGMSAEYFANADLTGTPVTKRVDPDIQFSWEKNSPAPGVPGDSAYSVRWRGTIKPTQTGEYVFGVASDDGSRVLLDGKSVVDFWGEHAIGTKTGVAQLEAGKTYHLTVEYNNTHGRAEMHFGWGFHGYSDVVKKRIAEADAVIFAGGLDWQMEHEGDDRPWEIPSEQADELGMLAALNPKLVVAINAGGNLGLGGHLKDIPALLWAWYPGQNGNTALAQIIFGDINPSGHLPDSFEKKFEDAPAFGNYPGNTTNGGSVSFAEDIYVGYRWFDKKAIEPEFPFGFGLSYTTFDLTHLKVTSDGTGNSRHFVVTADVTNTGSRSGAAVVQLYVRPLKSAVDRPVQELKGFDRVELKARETRKVRLQLEAKDFATYNEAKGAWETPPGDYEIAVGRSSRDIVVKTSIPW